MLDGLQAGKIVGKGAPPEFIQVVTQLAVEHDRQLAVDCIRAYHFGARFNVELEIMLPGDMTVAASHDIALALQHKVGRGRGRKGERVDFHARYQCGWRCGDATPCITSSMMTLQFGSMAVRSMAISQYGSIAV